MTTLLAQQTLDNGMTLTVEDLSKKIVGDRWLVRVSCQATIPVPVDFVSAHDLEDDPTLRQEVLASLGSEVSFAMTKERNFVDGDEQPDVLRAMVEDIFANMVAYLSNQRFPEKLLRKRYGEAKQACLVARQYARIEHDGEEDDGPADFSACFRD